MALGTYNNNQKKESSPNIFGYSFANPVSQIDPSMLSFRMWSSSLVISISPKSAEGEEGAKYDRDNAVSIYLNHTKASILAMILQRFLDEPETFNEKNSSVQAGQGLITVSTGKEFGKKNSPCLIIRKISEEGIVESSYAYEFKRNFNCSIDGFDPNNPSNYTKDYDRFKDLEIKQVIYQLVSYARAMSNSVAFSVLHNNYWNTNRIFSNQYKIANKLGVDLSNTNPQQKKSFFNNEPQVQTASVGSTSNNTTTLNELEDLF